MEEIDIAIYEKCRSFKYKYNKPPTFLIVDFDTRYKIMKTGNFSIKGDGAYYYNNMKVACVEGLVTMTLEVR